jgi:hypothetical protein
MLLVQRDWQIITVTNLVKILLVQRNWQIITNKFSENTAWSERLVNNNC